MLEGWLKIDAKLSEM